ncbi:hypothetical protein D9M71_16920 [compost metagenome]
MHGRSKNVYFEAPEGGEHLQGLLNDFLKWFNKSCDDVLLDPLLCAALAQMDNRSIRLYAISIAILDDRKGYYDILQKCQSNAL